MDRIQTDRRTRTENEAPIAGESLLAEGEVCPSCASSNISVVIKAGKVFLDCFDCGQKTLLD